MKEPFFLLLSLVPAILTNAQEINMEPDFRDTTWSVVGLKMHSPVFNDNETVSAISGTYTLSLNSYLGNDWSMNIEFPFIVADTEFDSDNGLANLFISFRKWINPQRTSALSAGVYLPTIGSDNFLRTSVGLYSNIARLPMFLESSWTVYGNYSYNNPANRQGIFGVYAGPDVVIPSQDGDVELLTHMGIKGGYKFNMFHAWTEINGILILTEEALYSNSRLDGQVVFAGQFILDRVRPGLFYTFYFNDLIREVTPGVFGLKIDYLF